ncbi:hypothetical protein [Puniceibacterium sp. IMCC21224]|uniref:hypothetical protein n=1 Tax=Puniceibacterium sp. IMCC21224 TaxID=1618204 RepID=UPI00064DAD82|nr:hypothetical protein [Puniceibacterium sp. IMCC21224]KMK68920.1 hypothetical protein IMCC21224_113808 [Puniceibacterium sp. IMCC21224]
MGISTHLAAAATALVLSSGAALAWGDMYMGDATNNPNSNTLMHSYPTAQNFCPPGLQPVTAGGQICCGVPNAGPYVNRAGGTRKHTPKRISHTAMPYAPVGEKGVIYR